MKTKFTSISLIFLLGYLSCCQPAISEHSNSKALQCLTSYIEAMNSREENELLSFHTEVSVQQTEDQEAEKQRIAQVISSVIGWAKDKDLDLSS